MFVLVAVYSQDGEGGPTTGVDDGKAMLLLPSPLLFS